MDLRALYDAAGAAAPEPMADPHPGEEIQGHPGQPLPTSRAILPTPEAACEAATPPASFPDSGRPFTRDELRRAAFPDEWAALKDNPEALRQFAASLRMTGMWAECRERTASEWDALAPAPEAKDQPARPATCRDCAQWTPDTLNPRGGLGACGVPLPEAERLRRCPTPWPWTPGCRFGEPR